MRDTSRELIFFSLIGAIFLPAYTRDDDYFR